MVSFFLVFLGFLLIVGGIIFQVIRRGLQIKKLAQEGLLTRALILRKGTRPVGKGASSPRLFYQFTDPLGRIRRRSVHVSWEIYEASREGGEIEIVYLPQDPGVNAAKYMVDLVRGQLNKNSI